MHYLVDGYNYLHRARLLEKNRLEQGRSALAFRLAPLVRRGERVTIFWDARGGAAAGPMRESIGGVEMVFCREREGADGAIRAFVCLAREPRDLAVVSDDTDVTLAARQLKAHVLRVSALESLLAPCRAGARPEPEVPPGEEKPPPPRGAREVEDWLDYFGASPDERA